MNSYFVYILFSEKLNQYYTGSTLNIEKRLFEHNSGKSKHTSKGIPWVMIFSKKLANRTEVVRLEITIKKRGATRYLADLDKKNKQCSSAGTENKKSLIYSFSSILARVKNPRFITLAEIEHSACGARVERSNRAEITL